jgi:hypothetical protein
MAGWLRTLMLWPPDARAERLARHHSGDWGGVSPEDAKENDFSVKHGFRIVSSYTAGRTGERVWIITEADRSVYTVLLPKEYRWVTSAHQYSLIRKHAIQAGLRATLIPCKQEATWRT